MSLHRTSARLLVAVLGGWLMAASAPAAEWDPAAAAAIDLDAFRRIPVLDGGRKMPLDTFARHRLLQLSGRSRLGDEPAVSWLARVFFAPETLANDPIFLIEDPEAAQAIGLDAVRRERYTVEAIQSALPRLEEIARAAGAMESDDRTRVENELLRLYINVMEFSDLTHSFAFAQAVDAFAVEQTELRLRLGLSTESDAFSFLDIFRGGAGLRSIVQRISNVPQAEWTPLEQEAFWLSLNLYEWSQFYQDLEFVMIPVRGGDEERWSSAWSVLGGETRDPETLEAVVVLQAMARAYRRGDQASFDRAATSFTRFVRDRLPGDRDLQWIDLEVRMNDLNPFVRARVFYVLSFLAALGALFTRREYRRPGRLSTGLMWTAAGLCLLALVPHTTGLVMRIYIMGRPPVTNLFATFVFVAWACAVLGLVVEWVQRNALGVLSGAFCGIALLMVSGYFATDGDTMGKVVAVLSSNFWLATHVMTIALGYAGCVLAGLIGHAYLVGACVAPRRQVLLAALQRALYGVLGFGLIFTWFGTMLGGIWADQSWGRFWGWDPKENGALLIILWCAILFHARIARMIGEVGMAAGSALGIIFVMLAWLGVNLLGVGLHSYGFTSGLAFGLIVYITVQLVLVAVLAPVSRRRLAAAGQGDGS